VKFFSQIQYFSLLIERSSYTLAATKKVVSLICQLVMFFDVGIGPGKHSNRKYF